LKKAIYRHLKIGFCLILLVSILCSCGKTSESDEQTEMNEATKQTESISIENDDNKIENKTLRVYDNGSHTLAIWDYNKDEETMTLIFDEAKVICSYSVFEEMNTEETVTLYNGSDKDYNWRIQVSYNNIEDTYSVFLGDEENKLLYNQEDFSGDYFFKEEKKIGLTKNILDMPLSFEVAKRENTEPVTTSYKSRANGNWHYTVNKTDTQTLMIYEEEIFVLNYISVGEVKETVKGTYTIISDDGKYQEFRFVNADDATQTWTAKIWQTELEDDYGVSYDGIVYINSKNETMYYTGTKW